MSGPVSPLPPERPRPALSDERMALLRRLCTVDGEPASGIDSPAFPEEVVSLIDEVAALRAQVEAARRVQRRMGEAAHIALYQSDSISRFSGEKLTRWSDALTAALAARPLVEDPEEGPK